ncbi:hypothetical protein M407DRAFT_32551 [Tulasnella calospora MUT 4182]|uniref:Uncharacterized protein n=1 Tax=Tulasnella calospora MUT 4182 TaxID=1051891 RepID=A0A0C3Q4J2_9AGAM|nr:hypothetical protein M407DRAFT_32551 [Tulasnella calospora MUT 4182]
MDSDRPKRARIQTTKGLYVSANPESVGASSIATVPPPIQSGSISTSESPAPAFDSASTSNEDPPASNDPPLVTLSAPLSRQSRNSSSQSLAPSVTTHTSHSHSSNNTPAATPSLLTQSLPDSMSTARSNYRLEIDGRATINCAAESPLFKCKLALCYAFLEVHDSEQDEVGKLERCTLRCGIWKKASWVVTKKSAGGTGNFIDHMANRHGGVWVKAKRAEAVALGTIVDGPYQDISNMLVASPDHTGPRNPTVRQNFGDSTLI